MNHIGDTCAMDSETYKAMLPKLSEASQAFYSGKMSVKEYKSISGGFGTYAQRGGKEGMVRLRLAGGRITKDKMAFIADCIRKYNPSLVHITTCQSVQLHGLSGPEAVEIISGAADHGILTYGGGGDYPRNVTATPLSGVIAAPLAVQPYAECASRSLPNSAEGKKLPRKLKVGFSNTMENITDATARDLGFIARADGRFDVYSGGGLGANPKLGLLVYEGADSEDLCDYIAAMVRMFMKYGNYEDRSKARVRYMRDTLGDEGYVAKFRECLAEAEKDETVPKVFPDHILWFKRGDGTVPKDPRARPQARNGLYYVVYHPIGGRIAPSKFAEISDAVAPIDEAEVRVGPNETLYVINLTGAEADRIAAVTADGSRTLFESSMSCIGNTVCQIGLRDSYGLLTRLIEMEKAEGFADGVLPMVRISGCVSSCTAQQLGSVGLRGCAPVDGEPAFEILVNGSHVRGKERLGDTLGAVKESQIPDLFRDLGRTVQASGKSFREWYGGDASKLKAVAAPYLH